MEIISRKEAKALGLKKYFTGKPCSKGHICDRYVSTFQCTCCVKERKKNTVKRGITRSDNSSNCLGVRYIDAYNKDLVFYDGKICNICGNTIRYTNNSECVNCGAVRAASAKRKAYIKEYNSAEDNKTKNKLRMNKYRLNHSDEELRSKKYEYSNGPANYMSYCHLLTIEEDPVDTISGALKVRCAKCRKYFIPKQQEVNKRIQCLKGNYQGESRLYCSESCKDSCSIFGKHSNQTYLNISYGNTRPLQSSWKQLAIEEKRSNSTDGKLYCEQCGAGECVGLIAHHTDPVINNPIESADIDNCTLLCKDCHKKVHKQPGCTLSELRCG